MGNVEATLLYFSTVMKNWDNVTAVAPINALAAPQMADCIITFTLQSVTRAMLHGRLRRIIQEHNRSLLAEK